MKSFAETIVEVMEKQLKLQPRVGCCRLLKWLCLLLSNSHFASVSKNALCSVAAVQASLIQISPGICNTYIEELKDARIPYKDSPQLLGLLLEFSSSVPSVFDQWKLVLESVGILLKSVKLDLSKYATEILPQARHADEGRRHVALAVVGCLSQKSSNPDAVEAMFNAVKSIIGGSERRLAFPYQRVGMINALQELSCVADGKYLNSL
ncbi:similar to ILITYHIA [Actinidia rufa]|uniref:Similar to ILITYHIA n=1 Tax=Actinidia rufa TaxID=165716 RepID=A0A7J0EFY7_9ERIC|nr:similar to ILITYHIA [Actinidia rufa]